MRPLSVLRPALILQNADVIQSVLLTSSAQALDVPAGAGFVEFRATANIAVNYGNATATWPAATSTGSSNSEINPPLRSIGSTADCTGVSVISSSAGGVCSVAWYGRGGG